MALDKTKPYGEVYGQSTVRYEQDGKQFDVHGDEIKPKADAQVAETNAPKAPEAPNVEGAEPADAAKAPKKRGRKAK